jgi:L-fuculose-phosphate aldolase
MTSPLAAKREIVKVCQRLYERGLIAGPDGNVSVRVAPNRVIVTPAGMSEVDVTVDDLVELTLDGKKIRGSRRASSEVKVHLRIYERRPDVNAVVHAHPPTATGFAVAGEGFTDCILPEVIFQVGWVPLIPYATPGTTALADNFDPFIPSHDAFLMANHGATTAGPTLTIAHQRMESLEHTARIVLTARLLGRVNSLSQSDVQALVASRDAAGITGPYPGCLIPPGRAPQRGGGSS